jgi:hypothetical protein
VSREEAMKALIESGMDLRRDDIELGKRLERERIIKLLTEMKCGHYCRCMNNELCEVYAEAIELIKGEQK